MLKKTPAFETQPFMIKRVVSVKQFII